MKFLEVVGFGRNKLSVPNTWGISQVISKNTPKFVLYYYSLAVNTVLTVTLVMSLFQYCAAVYHCKTLRPWWSFILSECSIVTITIFVTILKVSVVEIIPYDALTVQMVLGRKISCFSRLLSPFY